MKNKAFIFDMNGVLINDEHLHEQAFAKVLQENGINFSHAEYQAFIMGRTDLDGLDNFTRERKLTIDLERIVDRKTGIYLSLLGNSIQAPEGLIELVKDLEKSYKIALTTNAYRGEAEMIVGAYGMHAHFDVTVAYGDFKNGKPDPEPYLLTAKKLALGPNCCVVMEDTQVGIRSAKAAGMKCIAIASTQSKESLKEADIIVDTFSQVSRKLADSLLEDEC